MNNTYLILDSASRVVRMERAAETPTAENLEAGVTPVQVLNWAGWPVQPYSAALLAYRDGQFVWDDPRTVSQAQDEQWSEVKASRDSVINGGVTWDGSVFDSDEVSQGRIAGAATLALMAVVAGQAEAFSKTWKLADNSTRVLSAADMMAVGITLGQMVQAAIDKGETLRLQIYASTSLDQIRNITWQS